MGVGRDHRDAGDHPRPTEPKVHLETVEGLLEQSVLSEGRLTSESTAAVGAGEEARLQGHRIADGEGWVVRSEGEELLPEALLYLPEVGCLLGEGSPMHLTEGGDHVGGKWCAP